IEIDETTGIDQAWQIALSYVKALAESRFTTQELRDIINFIDNSEYTMGAHIFEFNLLRIQTTYFENIIRQMEDATFTSIFIMHNIDSIDQITNQLLLDYLEKPN